MSTRAEARRQAESQSHSCVPLLGGLVTSSSGVSHWLVNVGMTETLLLNLPGIHGHYDLELVP